MCVRGSHATRNIARRCHATSAFLPPSCPARSLTLDRYPSALFHFLFRGARLRTGGHGRTVLGRGRWQLPSPVERHRGSPGDHRHRRSRRRRRSGRAAEVKRLCLHPYQQPTILGGVPELDQGAAERKVRGLGRFLGANAGDGRSRAGPPAARDGEPARGLVRSCAC